MQKTTSLKVRLSSWIVIVIASLVLTTAAGIAAADTVTYEGTIQGLNCTYFKRECPKDELDIYVALEDDFVLVLPDGKFFLLPNLSTLIKARHLTKKVRIRGDLNGSSIWVENLEVKDNGEYETVWNLKRQLEIKYKSQ